MQIGQGSDMYALDNAGRIFSYTWQTGIGYNHSDGSYKSYSTDQLAAPGQNQEILMSLTGRINGPDKIRNFNSRLAHRRYRHLVLVDYMGLAPNGPLFADPADANLLQWQSRPTDVSVANNIPYAPGSDTTGYDQVGETAWSGVEVRQRWPFASSYFSVTASWAPDGLEGEATYIPLAETPNLTTSPDPLSVPLSMGRRITEVVFPSAKVHMFEEFDREQAGSPYFAYDHARPAKLMFDGSVNDWVSGAARPSWSPGTDKIEWRQTYVPLHTFPIPLGGFGDPTLLSQRYRWTLGGLTGVDYPQPLMGNPNAGRSTR